MKIIFKAISFMLLCTMMLTSVACAKFESDEESSDSNFESYTSSESHIQTSKSTKKSTTNQTVLKTVKGYLLSASTPQDTYGNGMFFPSDIFLISGHTDPPV